MTTQPDGARFDRTSNNILRYDKLSHTEGMVITVRLPILLTNLAAWASGYPTGLEPGPPELDEYGVAYPALTKVEAGAAAPDKARQVLGRLERLMEQRSKAEREMADLCTLLGQAPVTPKRVAASDEVANDQWCRNCARHQHFSPRALDGSLDCSWCCSFRREYNELPPKSLVDRHARGERLNDEVIRRALRIPTA